MGLGCSLDLAAALDHAEDVALFHDQEIRSVDLDLGTRPFAEQHDVAELDVGRVDLAAFIARTGTEGLDFAS